MAKQLLRSGRGDKLKPSLVIDDTPKSPSIARVVPRSGPARMATAPVVALPPRRAESSGGAYSPGPEADRSVRTPLGLRTQSAALFALLAILVSSLRLAERTKAAAGDIAKLVKGAQAESTDTVLALEKGVKQMERGLVMMKEMADLSTQVQLSTQQQRAATGQVMDAIERIAEGSRSVATTAQDMASAAANQGVLASDLAGSERARGQKPVLVTVAPLRKHA